MLDHTNNACRQVQLLARRFHPSAQNVLLHEASRRRLPADFGVLAFQNIGGHPGQHGEILIDRLRGAVVVVPDFRAGRVNLAQRSNVAALDRFEQPIRHFERLFQGGLRLRHMLTPLVGAAEADPPGLDAGVLGAAGLDSAAAVEGGALTVGSGVGTDTVGSGPAWLGSDAGLAASDGTGAAAISAVPAPYSYTSTPPR